MKYEVNTIITGVARKSKVYEIEANSIPEAVKKWKNKDYKRMLSQEIYQFDEEEEKLDWVTNNRGDDEYFD